jgi:hypothetical protein
MNQLTMPTIISVKQFDTTLSVKIDKSDTDVRELMELFEKLLLAHGYQKESINKTICNIADQVREDVKKRSTTWEDKFGDDHIKSIIRKYS